MSPTQQTYTYNTPSSDTSYSIGNIQTQIQILHQLNARLLLRVSQLEDIVHNITDNHESTYDNIPDLEEITDEEGASDNEGYDDMPDLEEYISDNEGYDDMPDLEYDTDTDDTNDQNAITYHNCPLNNHPIYFNSSIIIV